MTRPAGEAARAAAAASLALAAWLGLADTLRAGAGLDPAAAAVTVLLWVATLAPLAALTAAIAAPLAARSARRARRHAGATDARDPARGREATAAVRAALASLIACPMAAAAVTALRSEPLAPAGAAVPAARSASAVDKASDGPGTPARSGGARRPDIALIVLDTLRADHLGSYGGPPALSPAFDALAAHAVLLERCFAPAAWTVPSHASLFTGLPPRTHGASFAVRPRLDDAFLTLAEALGRVGYRRVALVANPQLAVANLLQGFDTVREVDAPFEGLGLRRVWTTLGAPARWADLGARQAVNDVRSLLAGRLPPRTGDPAHAPPRAPLFLFVNLLEAHWRYLPPLGERRPLPPGMSWLEASVRSAAFYGPPAMVGNRAVAPRTRDAVRALYAASVRYQDRALGEIVRSIDRHLGPDTVVIVTADHGENLGEGGRWDHVFALDDPLIHVPMLVRHPQLAAGTRRQGTCSLLDVPATIAALTPGVELAPGQRGRNLLAAPEPAAGEALSFAEGDPYLPHLARFAGRDPVPGSDLRRRRLAAMLHAVRGTRFKYLHSSVEGESLYDLEQDPEEVHDVAALHPGRVRELRAALARWKRENPPHPGTSDADERSLRTLDAEARARLERLGYAP